MNQNPTLQERLDAIEERVNKATPGPWRGEYQELDGAVVYSDPDAHNGYFIVADVSFSDDYKRNPGHPTAEFIAHAREDVPFLLAELSRLRATVERVHPSAIAAAPPDLIAKLKAFFNAVHDGLCVDFDLLASEIMAICAHPVGAAVEVTDAMVQAAEDAFGECDYGLTSSIRAALEATLSAKAAPFDFKSHLARQHEWSERTFGPGARIYGVIDHIRKELLEIEADPGDLSEWIDVTILALDGAWRSGATPEEIIAALVAKQTKNEAREWPDWRNAEPNKAIEHVRYAAPTLAATPASGGDSA